MEQRAPFLPDVPSMGETVPGYDTEVWWGLVGPAGMPPDLVAKLSRDFVGALNNATVKERLTKLGASSIGSSRNRESAASAVRNASMVLGPPPVDLPPEEHALRGKDLDLVRSLVLLHLSPVSFSAGLLTIALLYACAG